MATTQQTYGSVAGLDPSHDWPCRVRRLTAFEVWTMSEVPPEERDNQSADVSGGEPDIESTVFAIPEACAPPTASADVED